MFKGKKFFPKIIFLFFFLFWFNKVIFQDHLFVFMDLTYYFYPLRNFLVESYQALTIPLWNPYLHNGFPFMANLQEGVFYPLSIIYFIVPFDYAFNFYILIHYFLAGLFSYLLGRDFNLSRSASILMAVLFTFGGYLISVLNMLSTLSAVVWLPLVFLIFRRILICHFVPALPAGKLDVKPIFLQISLAFILGFMFLGGEPTIVYWTFFLLLFYLLFYFFQLPAESKSLFNFILYLSILIIPCLLMIFLCAVQILPTWEFMRFTSRKTGLLFQEAAYWSIKPKELINIIQPYFIFNVFENFSTVQWLRTIYFGILPLILVIISPLFWQPMVGFLLFIFIFSIFISLGSFQPLYFLFYKFLPGLNLIRYPVKFFFLTSFSLSLLCAFTFDALIKNGFKIDQDKRLKILINIVFLVILLAAVLFFVFFFWQGLLIKLFMKANFFNFGITIIFTAAAVILLSLYARKALNTNFFVLFTFIIVLIDLFLANYNMNLTTPIPAYHVKPNNVKIVEKDKGFFRVFHSPVIEKRSSSWTEDEVRDFPSALVSLRDRFVLNQTMLFNLYSPFGYTSLCPYESVKIREKIYGQLSPSDSQLLNLMNVKYITTAEKLKPLPFGYKLVNIEKETRRDGKIYLYQNNNYLPRVFLVSNYFLAKDHNDALVKISNPSFNPKKEIVLEKIPQSLKANRFHLKHGMTKKIEHTVAEKAEIVEYKPQKVVIKTKKNKSAFLFLSDSYYPGWKAFVDGKESKIFRANYNFRAVVLPAGSHLVKFVYDPLSFKIGAWISGVSLVILLGSFLFLSFRTFFGISRRGHETSSG